ncbi:unnamed protein product [Polarella glacialis]|uniref:Uncharacterized protein n=1 Tax=Polarella glacialis TaxID=89957 RepID=A0A813ITU6_POLGL|nr:unnamed protein product [Polarella glacialis]
MNKTFILGTGAAFGNHYTTEEMKAAFRRQRLAAGDTECDLDFADRVLDACGFDMHSVALPLEDVFRRMSRSEYLEHRMTALIDLAQEAAENALAMWGGRRSEITHLCWGTMTGAMHSPTIDILLTKRLGLSCDVERTSVEGMGCLTGYRLLNIGRQIAKGNPNARVLVVEGDLRSAIGNSLPDHAGRADIVAASLFRDAASAAVVSGEKLAEGERACYELICGKSRIVEGTEHLVDYRELDCGEVRLYLHKELPNAVGHAEPAFIKALIAEARASKADPPEVTEMDIACHTGGPRVLHEVAKAADATDEQLAASWAVMKAHGNLSGASNLSVLDYQNRVVENGRQWVLCLAMGPGVCIEGLLLQRVSPPPRITESLLRLVARFVSRASDTCPEEEAIEQRVLRRQRRSKSESAASIFEAVLADVEEEEEEEQEQEADGIATRHTNDTLLPQKEDEEGKESACWRPKRPSPTHGGA